MTAFWRMNRGERMTAKFRGSQSQESRARGIERKIYRVPVREMFLHIRPNLPTKLGFPLRFSNLALFTLFAIPGYQELTAQGGREGQALGK